MTLLTISNAGLANILYTVSFENRNEHYVDVTMEIPANSGDSLIIGMPVWTPGSYKIREFSQHVDFCEAFNPELAPIKAERISKNQWKIATTETGAYYFRYRVYAFEISVRQSYCDQFHAFLHGTGIFMYVKGMEQNPYSLKINLPADWKNCETAMDKNGDFFVGPDYDALVDAPIACGNFDIATFDVMNVPHKIVMIGSGDYDLNLFKVDVAKICTEAAAIFESHPCKQYIHFIQNVASGGGGLEHANSQTSQMIRTEYHNPVSYKHLLSLVGHEYFHLWNVKRLRPKGLGPFDYDKEVYTDMLWFSEGFTSYYDDLMACRSGFYTKDEYYEILGKAIAQVENQPGAKLNSVSESSFTAWIKTYLSNENTANTQVSYYSKGMLIGWLTDLTIRETTKGKKSLDDVMKAMYERYYLKNNVGFEYEELLEVLKKISGTDFAPLYERWVKGTETPDYAGICAAAGLDIDTITNLQPMSLGIRTVPERKVSRIIYVRAGSAGAKAGLSVQDEIMRINGKAIKPDLETVLSKLKNREPFLIEFRRQGIVYSVNATPEDYITYKYVVKPLSAENKNKILKNWLNAKSSI